MKNLLFLPVIALCAFQACKPEQQVVACTDYPSIELGGTTLYVQPVGSPGFTDTYNWQAAIDYCNNLDFDGCDDWYLPGKDELHALALHKDEIGDFVKIPDYWSSTRDPSSQWKAFSETLLYDPVATRSTDVSQYLRCRCVRR